MVSGQVFFLIHFEMHLNLKYFGSLDILGYYLPTKGIFPVGFGVQCTIDESQ